MSKVTKEMIENWLGTDTDIPELLAELTNGEYKAEEFKQDVIDTWQYDKIVDRLVKKRRMYNEIKNTTK